MLSPLASDLYTHAGPDIGCISEKQVLDMVQQYRCLTLKVTHKHCYQFQLFSSPYMIEDYGE